MGPYIGYNYGTTSDAYAWNYWANSSTGSASYVNNRYLLNTTSFPTTGSNSADGIWIKYSTRGEWQVLLQGYDANNLQWIEYAQSGEEVKPLAAKVRDMFAARMAPRILTSSKPLATPGDIREARARQTLRRVIGEEKYRNFLIRGHVTVRSKSGKTYQIFPAHGITCVYQEGRMVERLCVVLAGNFPPTDSLIMRYLLILNDEQDFRKRAYKHEVLYKTKPVLPAPVLPITELYRKLKVA